MLQTAVAPNQWRDRPIEAGVLEVVMRPTRKSTLVLLVAGIVLFLLSASGQPDGPWTDGPSWLGATGWFGFLACGLLLIVSGLYAAVSWVRNRDRYSTR
jgi:hypothetical protein